jgi:hypothetical protein
MSQHGWPPSRVLCSSNSRLWTLLTKGSVFTDPLFYEIDVGITVQVGAQAL